MCFAPFVLDQMGQNCKCENFFKVWLTEFVHCNQENEKVYKTFLFLKGWKKSIIAKLLDTFPLWLQLLRYKTQILLPQTYLCTLQTCRKSNLFKLDHTCPLCALIVKTVTAYFPNTFAFDGSNFIQMELDQFLMFLNMLGHKKLLFFFIHL